MLEKQVVSIQLDKSYIQNMYEVGFFCKARKVRKTTYTLRACISGVTSLIVTS